jgi:cbb3-type cytochrome oxidase maturation protein
VEATVAQTLFTLAMALIFGGFLIWALRTRQFSDVEDPNRRLFGERDAEPDPPDAHACEAKEHPHPEEEQS